MPGSGDGGDLRLAATALEVSGTTFDRAVINLAGSISALRAKATLSGKSGEFSAQATANQDGEQWRGRLLQLRLAPPRIAAWNLQSPVAWRYGADTIDLDRACLASTGDGRVCAQANASRISVQGTQLPWALAEPWLADTSLDLAPFGTVDFNGDVVSDKAGAWSGGLTATSSSGGLRLDPSSKQTVLAFSNLRANARLLASRLTVGLQAGLEEGGSIIGDLRVDGLSGNAPMQGNLRFDMRQLDWIELFSAEVADPTGQLTGNLSFAGTLASPSIDGEARLSRFAAELPGQGVVLSGGEFTLRGEPGGEARIEGSVQSGKGRLLVDGSLNLRDKNSPVDLHLSGVNITVADTPDLQATMSPDLRLRRNDGIWQVRGTVGVPMARLDLERLDNSVSVSPDVVVIDPRVPASASALFFDTDVVLQLGDDVKLRGFGLDGGLTGSLRVRDRSDREALMTGTLNVSGTYIAYGRALQIKRGRLGFINAAIDNPTLDILAEREFESVTVGVRVRGLAAAPETTITSSPAMATSEALSWLMIGRPLSTASGSQLQQINASSLALSAGTNLLAQRLGTRLGLDTADIGATRALGESTFTIGKQVSPRLFVSYGVSLIGTASSMPGMRRTCSSRKAADCLYHPHLY
ncbi:MAG: translocation/assembly module TamB domain-containing protein [Gammaproteobacteria bacterium]|nr:translocation/assembly module TamB domain-containing protein [Gammaproteobacteria bacterium]